MFFRTFAFVLAVTAGAIAVPGHGSSSQCDTGSLQCCQKTISGGESNILTGLIGIVEGIIGIDCTPITAIGTGSGADCTQDPVCCTDVSQTGLINLGCTPVNLNL